jgi:signal transduction histidine kinase
MSWSPARFTPRGTGSVDLSAVPAWLEAAREGRPLEVADAARLPDGDPLRGLLAGWGCLALLALPLMEEERCTGFLVVELLGAARRIGADEFAALVVACELFANSGMRRQRELALEQALLDARASIRAKDAFLATMSHELRTPLNGIIGLAELLADARPGEDQRGRAATIACSARELLEVIQGVIELATPSPAIPARWSPGPSPAWPRRPALAPWWCIAAMACQRA